MRISRSRSPEEQREIRALLSDLPVRVTHTPLSGPGRAYHVVGVARSVLRWLDVYLDTPAQAAFLAEELPGHLLMPPVWLTEVQVTGSVAWAGGYMAAKKTCLPRGGVFRSATTVLLAQEPCPYQEEPDRTRYRLGLESYLSDVVAHVKTARHVQETQDNVAQAS